MISDEELNHAATRDIEFEIVQWCGATGMSISDAKAMLEGARKTQEIASELMERRDTMRRLDAAISGQEANGNGAMSLRNIRALMVPR
jgi:DNA-binding transcriptional MerR regulator